MPDAAFTTFEKAARATVKRLSAENTWLRHSLMEVEIRVAGMHAYLDGLETRVRTLKRQLPAVTPTPPQNP